MSDANSNVSLWKLGTVQRTQLTVPAGVQNPAFVTIIAASGNDGSGALNKVLNGYAPSTSIDISQSVDFGITKALDKNFLVSEFGDNPVKITITGLHVFRRTGSNCMDDTDSIIEFYKNYKLSHNPEARIQIGITGKTEQAQTFECVVLSCRTQAIQDYLPAGAAVYELMLVGVAK